MLTNNLGIGTPHTINITCTRHNHASYSRHRYLLIDRRLIPLGVRPRSLRGFLDSAAATAAIPVARGLVRLASRPRSGRHRAVLEPDAHILHGHVGRQELLEHDHAVSGHPVERIAHRSGVWVFAVEEAAVARRIVAHLVACRSVVLYLFKSITHGHYIKYSYETGPGTNF